ncbi:HlyD family secretion protein [Candidatus Liberibacter sp.]|uniref:HlyD family secretion protein n=1 Tax=Candidatus Liberibacter sp. TaxID=34022 RepID=UPI0015F672EF|nr:HlyD family efflux transporter periplasmic adaptor subunit [Candidatus Liberibacter sp.]MBA5723817.1 HlyD family efflux transporter periplasmic adaptor subunit [Candidatus Liberibacter sp.]
MRNISWKNLKKLYFTPLEQIALLFTFGIIILAIWAIILPIEIRLSSSGEILNDDNIVEIRSPFSAMISDFQIENGAKVLKGDPILKFEDFEIKDLIDLTNSRITDLKCRIDNARSELNFLNNQHSVIEKTFEKKDEKFLIPLKNYLPICSKTSNYGIYVLYESLQLKLTRIQNIYADHHDLENKISLSRALLLSYKEDLTTAEKLFNKNIISKNDLHQQERIVHKSDLDLTEHLSAQGSLLRRIDELRDESHVEFANYLQDKSLELDNHQRAFIDETSKLTILRNKLSQYTILSPITGTVVYTYSFTSINYAQQSQLIMKISPNSNLSYIRAKVTPQQIQNVQYGKTAIVRFPTYSALREKRFKAIIETISPTITQNNNGSQIQNYYEVVLKITDPAYSEKKIDLHSGAPAEILFASENTTLAKEIIHPIIKNWPKIFER